MSFCCKLLFIGLIIFREFYLILICRQTKVVPVLVRGAQRVTVTLGIFWNKKAGVSN